VSGWPSDRHKVFTKLKEILKTENTLQLTNSLALGLAWLALFSSLALFGHFGSFCGGF